MFKSGRPGVTGTSNLLPGLMARQPPHSRFALVWNGRVFGRQPSKDLKWSAAVGVGATSTVTLLLRLLVTSVTPIPTGLSRNTTSLRPTSPKFSGLVVFVVLGQAQPAQQLRQQRTLNPCLSDESG